MWLCGPVVALLWPCCGGVAVWPCGPAVVVFGRHGFLLRAPHGGSNGCSGGIPGTAGDAEADSADGEGSDAFVEFTVMGHDDCAIYLESPAEGGCS